MDGYEMTNFSSSRTYDQPVKKNTQTNKESYTNLFMPLTPAIIGMVMISLITGFMLIKVHKDLSGINHDKNDKLTMAKNLVLACIIFSFFLLVYIFVVFGVIISGKSPSSICNALVAIGYGLFWICTMMLISANSILFDIHLSMNNQLFVAQAIKDINTTMIISYMVVLSVIVLMALSNRSIPKV